MAQLQLSKEHLLVNGVSVADGYAKASPLAAFIEILGPFSRVSEGAVSEFFTWDDLGLCVLRDLISGETSALTCYLDEGERCRRFHPHRSFTGELEINGNRVERSWGGQLEAVGLTAPPDHRNCWSRGLGSYDLTAETDRKVREVLNVSIGFSISRW